MKTKRTIASILAAVMAFSALPILSVNAADTAALGDVDGDGVITAVITPSPSTSPSAAVSAAFTESIGRAEKAMTAARMLAIVRFVFIKIASLHMFT